jgi:hypothetical protein
MMHHREGAKLDKLTKNGGRDPAASNRAGRVTYSAPTKKQGLPQFFGATATFPEMERNCVRYTTVTFGL